MQIFRLTAASADHTPADGRGPEARQAWASLCRFAAETKREKLAFFRVDPRASICLYGRGMPELVHLPYGQHFQTAASARPYKSLCLI